MSNEEIVRNLSESCETVRIHLERKAPRKAAQAVCDGLRSLVNDNGSFWTNFYSASELLIKYQDGFKAVLDELVEFIDLEGAVLSRLGIDGAVSEPILADIYGMIALTQYAPRDLTVAGLERLKEDVEKAAAIICENSKGPVRRAVDWVFSVKGLRILGGATVTAANFAVLHSPGIIAPYLSPALKPFEEVLMPASISFGGWCMGEEASKVIKMFNKDSDK